MTTAPARRNKAAIIGGGVIGGGWAARFLLHGWDVHISDPDPDVERKVNEVLENARYALPQLIDVAMPGEGRLVYADSIGTAVVDALWVQESVPERLNIKQSVYAEIQKYAPEDAVIGSSTSGFKPSQLREGATLPGNIIVAHPFNPVYLLPLIELVPGAKANAEIVDRAKNILLDIGMKPLLVRAEIDAHIADRFLEAVWREALWLIKDDIATTEEIDDAIRFGFGLRWAQMGLFETYRIAGGEAGMSHFIEQFGPCLSWPWTKLMDVPELTDELVKKIVDQSDKQSGQHSISELERIRDDNLVAMMRALKERNWAAGAVLLAHDQRLRTAEIANLTHLEIGQTLSLFKGAVLPSWIDYTGHMTEASYLAVFSTIADALLAMIGVDANYIESGRNYSTVETHILHCAEAKAGESLRGTCQVLFADDERLHVFQRLYAVDNRLLATAEQMLLHVDIIAAKACAADDAVLGKLASIVDAHSSLEKPVEAGRHIDNHSPPGV